MTTLGRYRLIDSSRPPSAFMGGMASGSGFFHLIRPELWPIEGGPRAGWLMTTRDPPAEEAIAAVLADDPVTLELAAEFVAGLVTTTWPLGTSQIDPTWVVTAVEPGGQPGIAVAP
jgi:hypothetical protein